MNLNRSTTLAGLVMPNPLMNGAYIGSKTQADVKSLALSSAGAVVVGSISVKSRPRNRGQGYWLHKEGWYSLNSLGLPNGGLEYFETALPKMVALAHAQLKPLIANVVGFSKEEFAALISLAETSGADMVELNLSCPNVWEGGQQKKIISYHPLMIKELLAHLGRRKPGIKLCLKLSPLPPDILAEVAAIIGESDIVQVVTATNSYPNASNTTGTGGEEVLGGLAGRALKPISLGVVKQLRTSLPDRIAIIGCGGISSAADVRDYLRAGAVSVQIATALKETGPRLFQKILTGA